jgi:DNA-binding NtrC family response regulator
VPFPSQRSPQERVLSVAPLLAGASPAIHQLRAQIRRIAPYFHVVSLTGAPGCGEEQVARALHEGCPYHDRPFHMLTAAQAEDHFAPQRPHPVLDGFLYLAEAEHLSPAAQTGLLRLLRERSHRHLRIVAFTGRGLRPLIGAGLFNVELAGQLGALSIPLPPLSERKADLPVLFPTVLRQVSSGHLIRAPYLSEGFLQAVAAYDWPGNLDQMRSVADWLLASRTGTLQAEDLATALDATANSGRQEDAPPVRLVPLEQVVHEHIRSVLMACNGNKLRAAEVLGISRSTLYRMLDNPAAFAQLPMAG